MNTGLKLKSQGFKIEDGLIKFEYSNKFNIRVNNFRSKGQQTYTPLDRIVQAIKEHQQPNKNNVKQEVQDIEKLKIKSEIEVKSEDQSDCFIEKIDYTK